MNFREKELEDYIWQDPVRLSEVMIPRSKDAAPAELVRLGRQVRCGTGIIDLLFYSFTTVYVVELKSVKATTQSLGQLARYGLHIEQALSHIESRRLGLSGAPFIDYLTCRFENFRVQSVLIAPDFDEDVLAVNSEYFQTILASKQNDTYILSWATHGNFTKTKNNDEALHIALMPYMENMLRLSEKRRLFEDASDLGESISFIPPMSTPFN